MRQFRLPLNVLLAFVGGFADAGCYVFAGCFAGHITGNTLLAAISLVREQWEQAASCASAVLCFVAGTFLGSLTKPGKDNSKQWRFPMTLVVEITLLTSAALVGRSIGFVGHHAFVLLVSLGLGLQNGSFNKTGTTSVRTTYITGMTTGLLGRLAKDPSAARERVVPITILCFFLGGMAGGFTILREGSISLLSAVIVLGIATLRSSEQLA